MAYSYVSDIHTRSYVNLDKWELVLTLVILETYSDRVRIFDVVLPQHADLVGSVR